MAAAMSTLLNSDTESDDDTISKLNINKDFASKYDTWRRKEELQKLKDRYGEEAAKRLDNVGNDGSSSDDDEEEDEDAAEWTEDNEKDFLKTLAYLKKKDPSIYDNSVKFFKNVEQGAELEEVTKKKKTKDKPLFLRDYKRQLILEKSNKLSEGEEEMDTDRQELTASPTPVEEERAIKESLKSVLRDSDDDGDVDEWGRLFTKRNKTQQELDKENEDYLEWLNGQREHLQDENVELELNPLREYWSDPRLDEGEKFLKDYILNKRFLEGEDKNHIPTYDEIVHDSDEDLSADEQTLEHQEEFEHKFNFRFEEPDQEFLKRYPRVMENTLRRKDDRRKVKRVEWREKKEKAKLRKLEEVKQLKALKRKELEERIQKLKEITGNAELGFKDEDIEGDFDPSEYDKRMQQLFNEEFYEEDQDTQKPVFPDLDEELEIENWDQWGGSSRQQNDSEMWNNADLHCEDPNFNMDCDYDPKAELQQEIIESTRGRRKRKRQSKLAQALAAKKPVFDPKEKTFEQYLDEYYSLDFEDVIGDQPCRFKYRKVVPNSFGLTVEEILSADDKELNSWCSLRKAVQFRPEAQELYDVKAYQAKANKECLKRKYLKSLYTVKNEGDAYEEKPDPGGQVKATGHEEVDTGVVHGTSEATEPISVNSKDGNTANVLSEHSNDKKKKKKSKKRKLANGVTVRTENANAEMSPQNVNDSGHSNVNSKKRKKRKKNTANTEVNASTGNVKYGVSTIQNNLNRKHFVPRRKGMGTPSNQDIGISDARLRAYGIRPKKFKNKLKYGNKSNFVNLL